jgi:SAM-dependent methyltransferase
MDPNAHNWGCGIYAEWSRKRVAKTAQILGTAWFPGKRVLDVACGHGMNGKGLAALGADVLFTDARQHHVDVLKADGFNAEVMDNEKEWTVQGTFDLVIHWGLLYHVDNWKQDIRNAMEHTPLLCLETLISTGSDPNEEIKVIEKLETQDHAVSGIGTIMPAIVFENYVTSLGCTFQRYDDSDMTVHSHHCYDWDTNIGVNRSLYLENRGQRRFWMVRR